MVAIVCVTVMVGATGLSVSGQGPREWRDYAGGPDSSRFVAASQITKANVQTLQVAWTYPSGQTDFNNSSFSTSSPAFITRMMRMSVALGAR